MILEAIAATVLASSLQTAAGSWGCIVDEQSGRLRRPEAGETALPREQSVVDRDWFRDGRAVTIDGRTYAKFGLPRVIEYGALERATSFDGVPFLKEKGANDLKVLYALEYTGPEYACAWQPYVEAKPEAEKEAR